MKNLIKRKLIHIALLVMIIGVLYLSVNLPQSSAWFTYADDHEQSIIVGTIDLAVSEGTSSNFTTNINASSVTVLGDDVHFNDVVTVLEIAFVNSGTIPIVIDGSISEPLSGNSPGLLYYVKTSDVSSEDYLNEMLPLVDITNFMTLKSSLEIVNNNSLQYLNETIVLYPQDEYSIKIIIWVDYHEGNFNTVGFSVKQFLLNLQFTYYQFIE